MHSREQLLNTVKSKFPTGTGVEVGCFKGEFSRFILEHWQGTLWMIDPWRTLPDEDYFDYTNTKNHSTTYAETMKNIEGFEDRGYMIRALSNQAVNLFADNSVDFVYIDGNHSYDYVKEDIKLWWPKVKSGGYLMGHDYLSPEDPTWWYTDELYTDERKKDKYIWANNDQDFAGVFGVNPAVDEFAAENNIMVSVTCENWYGSWWTIKP